jgi:hypothetical protein
MIFDENEKPEAVVDKKSEELIREFQYGNFNPIMKNLYEHILNILVREMKYSRDG